MGSKRAENATRRGLEGLLFDCLKKEKVGVMGTLLHMTQAPSVCTVLAWRHHLEVQYKKYRSGESYTKILLNKHQYMIIVQVMTRFSVAKTPDSTAVVCRCRMFEAFLCILPTEHRDIKDASLGSGQPAARAVLVHRLPGHPGPFAGVSNWPIDLSGKYIFAECTGVL